MIDGPARDFLGYGPQPPDPKWPGGARLALNFVINVEEGSEASILDGDARTESGLTEVPSSPVPGGQRDLAAESMFEYGSRVGFWRLARLFAERGLPLTWFACAVALERNSEIAAAIGQSGNDICAHGLRWEEHFRLAPEDERTRIRDAFDRITRATGISPSGWYCRYGPGTGTRRLVIEHGGFRYDSDAYNDELPWWHAHDGGHHLVVPYTLVNNDARFARLAIGTADDFHGNLRDAFDVLYAEGARSPKMMSVGLHPRIVGHPARSAGLARFLDHVLAHDDVWVTRRVDIAEHWHRLHSPA